MSQVRPLIDGWVGYGEGASVLVETGTLLDADHPAVLARPELFEPIEPPATPAKATPKKSAKADG